MWLLTTIGFFSVVQKNDDTAIGTLTVRARAASDLDALRQHYLPTLGKTTTKAGTDYPFRAKAPAADVADAIARVIKDTTYSNFKDAVKQRQGSRRAAVYSKVWHSLLAVEDLEPVTATQQSVVAAKKSVAKPTVATVHPKLNDKGQPVTLAAPSVPTPLNTWVEPDLLARVIPEGPMPDQLNGVAIAASADRPLTKSGWEQLAKQSQIHEPVFKVPSGMVAAAGAVIREADGRFWIVSPSNGFAGYTATFPKGGLEGMTTQAAAHKEVFEESGLQIRLVKWLADLPRSQSYTRYYLAERIGGNPADMGWETQAVSLVPPSILASTVTHPYDQPLLKSLLIPNDSAIHE